MPRLEQMATSPAPLRRVGGQRWGLLALPASALLAAACAPLSPQTSDLRPQYGFTSRAASAPQGLYGQLCGPSLTDAQLEAAGCPRFYGLLPAAVDDADAARLRILRAEIDDSGAPWLVSAAAYPVGAYALYRSLFGHGDEVRREVTRLGLAGSAAFGWVKSRESPQRQQIRLAAADALSCAMYGSVARYLYERKYIQGDTARSAGEAASGPGEGQGASAAVATRAGAGSASLDNEASLIQSRSALRRAIRTLNDALISLRAALAATPEAFQRVGAYRNGCDSRGATSTTCQSRGQGEAPVVSDANTEHGLARQTLEEAEQRLLTAGRSLRAAQGLQDRIDNAPHALLHTVRTIEAAANKAVQATEADVDSLRRAVGGMKLGSQDLSSVLSQAATPPSTSPTAPGGGTAEGQSGTSKARKAGPAKAALKLSADELSARVDVNRALVKSHAEVRTALFKLIGAEEQIQAYLEVDRERAAALQGRDECQFLPPGLKLVVDPQEAVITVAPGGTQRFVAQGGIQMPTISLAGTSSLRTSDLLRTEPDATAGRQSLTVVISPAASAPEQDLQLVFRNGDLLQQRTVAIRKPAGGGK